MFAAGAKEMLEEEELMLFWLLEELGVLLEEPDELEDPEELDVLADTFTVQVAETPLLAFTVILAVPSFLAVTFPLLLTVATDSLSELQE